MSTFLFSYRTSRDPAPATPEAMAAWQAWFEELGDDLVDGGNPVFDRRAVGDCPDGTVLGGYSLVSASDLDAAVALADGCPLLARGGSVEVGELTLLNPGSATSTADDHARATGLAG